MKKTVVFAVLFAALLTAFALSSCKLPDEDEWVPASGVNTTEETVANTTQQKNTSSSVFPLERPCRMELSEQNVQFQVALSMLKSGDREHAAVLYDFSKRIALHNGSGAVVTESGDRIAFYLEDGTYETVSRPCRVFAVDWGYDADLLEDGTAKSRWAGDEIYDVISVTAGYDLLAGIKPDGTVEWIGTSNYNEINNWSDIIEIDVGWSHVAALRGDGTVLATGRNEYGECDVESWRDIVAIGTGNYYTAGLKSDGTVLITGSNEYNAETVEKWDRIIAIAAGECNLLGLKLDGTVVVEGDLNDYARNEIASWSDLVGISAGLEEAIGLRSDGTVLITGFTYSNTFSDLKLW